MFKFILKWILRFEIVIFFWRNPMTIIAITGSVGKTSTKEAISNVLANNSNVITNVGNLNTEFGIPLSLLRLTFTPTFFGYCKNIILGFLRCFKKIPYKFAVLEMGAGKPGDLSYLISFIKPNVGVITSIGESHLEFFKTKEALKKEKTLVVKSLDPNGWAVLNGDDENLSNIQLPTSHVLYYGFKTTNDIYASDIVITTNGTSFKIHWGGSFVPVMINTFGDGYVYASLAAAATGIIFGLNLAEIADRLSKLKTLPGRLNVLVKDQITVIDDTYNASLQSMAVALNFLKDNKGRKIAVLGDMLELGSFEAEGHIKVGKKVSEIADIFIGVGKRMEIACDGARENMLEKNVISVSSALDASKLLQSILKAGDVILIKGSQAMHMDDIITLLWKQ